MMSQAAVEAEQLLRSGQAQSAMNVLGTAASKGDPDALLMLGELSLVGQIVHRDLPLSRDLFRRSAEAGSQAGAAVYRAFVANGTGGPADWPKAVELLQAAARFDPDSERELAVISQMALSSDGEPVVRADGELLSSSPEVHLFRGLLTAAECDYLIGASTPRLGPSRVIDPGTGELIPNPVRTSEGASFPLAAESPAIHALCRRLAAASGTDVGQGEPLQVLCYSAGQEYKPHFDAIDRVENQRILTFLVYLNDDFEGGETEFLSTGLKVKGSKGDGLLFRNADDAGHPDLNSQHAGLPPTTGVKFLASRWIRQKPVLQSHG
jgi:prolyl 4-hydroxylase